MLKVVFWVILFFIVVYLSLFFTGRDKRSYQVLPMDGLVVVNSEEKEVSQLALDYQPKMYISSSTPSPKLLWTWYEVVLRDTEVDIVYYQNWEDEINPSVVIHKMYRLFRAAYYGYPTYDVEFFQISVSLETGDITQLLFETSPGDDYYVTISEHIIARYERQPDGSFVRTLISRENESVLDKSVEPVLLEGNRVLVLAQTWNHLSTLVPTLRSDLIFLDSPLKYLSDKDYSSLKFARKSQSDHKTVENKISSFIASLGLFILVLIPAGVIKFFSSITRKRRQ